MQYTHCCIVQLKDKHPEALLTMQFWTHFTQTTAGGIILPQKATKASNEATVVAVGPGLRTQVRSIFLGADPIAVDMLLQSDNSLWDMLTHFNT